MNVASLLSGDNPRQRQPTSYAPPPPPPNSHYQDYKLGAPRKYPDPPPPQDRRSDSDPSAKRPEPDYRAYDHRPPPPSNYPPGQQPPSNYGIPQTYPSYSNGYPPLPPPPPPNPYPHHPHPSYPHHSHPPIPPSNPAHHVSHHHHHHHPQSYPPPPPQHPSYHPHSHPQHHHHHPPKVEAPIHGNPPMPPPSNQLRHAPVPYPSSYANSPSSAFGPPPPVGFTQQPHHTHTNNYGPPPYASNSDNYMPSPGPFHSVDQPPPTPRPHSTARSTPIPVHHSNTRRVSDSSTAPITRPSLSDLETSSHSTMFTPQIMAEFSSALSSESIALLPDLGSFVYPNLPMPLALNASGGELALNPTGLRTVPPPEYTPYSASDNSSARQTLVASSEELRLPPQALYCVITVYLAAPHLLANIPDRHDGAFKLWGSQSYGGYTDDSDIRLVLIHSGFTSLENMARTKAEGKDLRVRLKVGRTSRARYVGGYAEIRGSDQTRLGRSPSSSPSKHSPPMEKADKLQNENGTPVIKSFAWGNSHDGGSIEVISCEVVQRGVAHGLHAPNRKARMAQFARQRARLKMAPQPDHLPTISHLDAPSVSPLSLFDRLTEDKRTNRQPSAPSEADTLVTAESEAGKAEIFDEQTRKEAVEVSQWSLVMNFGNPLLQKRKASEMKVDPSYPNLQTTNYFRYDPLVLQRLTLHGGTDHSLDLRTETHLVDFETRAAKKRKVGADRQQKMPSLVLANKDERYILTPVITPNSQEVTFSLSALPRSSRRDATQSNNATTKNHILASNLTSNDLRFVKNGMYVWLPHDHTMGSIENLPMAEDDGEALSSRSLDDLLDDQATPPGRVGWFCRVHQWTFLDSISVADDHHTSNDKPSPSPISPSNSS